MLADDFQFISWFHFAEELDPPQYSTSSHAFVLCKEALFKFENLTCVIDRTIANVVQAGLHANQDDCGEHRLRPCFVDYFRGDEEVLRLQTGYLPLG